ncbi:MAG: ribosome assembly cofactor RimP [Bacteroidota bacterium]
MVDKKKIATFIQEELDENMFLVEVNVSSSNVIKVFIDSFEGLTIDQCVQISRKLEQELDRDKEDFELQVSSPGLSEPFRVKEQYLKNVGQEVEIVTTEGVKFAGELLEAGNEEILLKTAKRERVEGHKKKQLIVKEHQLKYGEIKSAKVVVSFKKAN